MSKLDNSMSAKALRAVATQLQNKADATRSRTEKRELLAQRRQVLAKLSEVEAKVAGDKTVQAHLSQIAIKAACSRVRNQMAGTRGKARAELADKLAAFEARLAA